MESEQKNIFTLNSELYRPQFSSEWDNRVLYDLSEWVNGMTFRNIHFSPIGKPVIKIAEIKNGISGQTKFTEAEYDPIYHVTDGDMLFSWSGQPETSIDVFRWRGPDGWLNQHIFKVHPKAGCQELYFFYLLKYLNQNFVRIARNKQTTGLGHVTKKDLQNITVGIPSDTEQRAIAHILGSLDDKIELNRQMNETLEAMARVIFKSWFVDFDPVRAKAEGRDPGLPNEIAALFPDIFEDSELGEIPKGWKSRSLYDSAKYINGAAYRNFHFTDEEGALPVVKIAELKNGVTGQTKFTKTEMDDKYRIDDGEILLSWSGNPDTSIDTFVWSGGAAWLNQHIFRVLSHQESEKHFVFYLLKYLRPVFAEIARNKQTTGLGHFTARDMKRLMAVHPPEELLAKFNDLVGPIFDRWHSNLFESNTLASLRDTLLPKLISGELRVPDAEKLVETVI